jgi:putative redox protein
MPTELTVHAVHQGEMKITATAGDFSLGMDYPVRPGQAGLTPLQLLLASLAGCSGNTVAALLRRSGQPVTGLEVSVHARRRDEHPTVFTSITLHFIVRGSGVDRDAVSRALAVSEEQLCPVWIMLKAGTPITATFEITED